MLRAKHRDEERKIPICISEELPVLAPKFAKRPPCIFAILTNVGLVTLVGESPGLPSSIGHPVIAVILLNRRSAPHGPKRNGLKEQRFHDAPSRPPQARALLSFVLVVGVLIHVRTPSWFERQIAKGRPQEPLKHELGPGALRRNRAPAHEVWDAPGAGQVGQIFRRRRWHKARLRQHTG